MWRCCWTNVEVFFSQNLPEVPQFRAQGQFSIMDELPVSQRLGTGSPRSNTGGEEVFLGLDDIIDLTGSGAHAPRAGTMRHKRQQALPTALQGEFSNRKDLMNALNEHACTAGKCIQLDRAGTTSAYAVRVAWTARATW